MSEKSRSTDSSLWSGLIGDGRPALGTVGMALAFAGGLAVYLGVTRQLLPHDLAYLGMSASELQSVADGRLMDSWCTTGLPGAGHCSPWV